MSNALLFVVCGVMLLAFLLVWAFCAGGGMGDEDGDGWQHAGVV